MAGARNSLIVTTTSSVALYILNNKRHFINEMEARQGVFVTVQASDKLQGANFLIEKGHAAPVATRRPDRAAVNMDWGFADDAAEGEAGEAEAEDGEATAGSAETRGRGRDEDGREGGRRRRRRRGRRSGEGRGEPRGESRRGEETAQPYDDELARITTGRSKPGAAGIRRRRRSSARTTRRRTAMRPAGRASATLTRKAMAGGGGAAGVADGAVVTARVLTRPRSGWPMASSRPTAERAMPALKPPAETMSRRRSSRSRLRSASPGVALPSRRTPHAARRRRSPPRERAP